MRSGFDISLDNRVVICGEANVGKTALFRTICGIDHEEQYTPTRIAQQSFYTASNGIKLAVWDTGGLPDLRNLIHVFLEKIQVAVIVVDLTNRESFEKIDQWIKDITDRNDVAPLIFVALNRVSQSVINSIELDHLQAREDIRVFEIDAVTGERVRVMMDAIATSWEKEKEERLRPRSSSPASPTPAKDSGSSTPAGAGQCCALQ